MDALDTPDLDARNLAYRALRTNPLLFKRRLRHWASASAGDPLAVAVTIETANRLAGLNIEALVPMSMKGQFSGFPAPALAHLVAALVPVWRRVTGRKVALFSSYKEGLEEKRCLFADWLGEMHEVMGLAAPSLWRVIAIVRHDERTTK